MDKAFGLLKNSFGGGGLDSQKYQTSRNNNENHWPDEEEAKEQYFPSD